MVNPIGGQVGKYGPDKYTRAVYWTGTWENNQFTPDYLTPKNLDLIHGHLSPTVEEDAQGNINAIGIVDERRSTAAQLNAGWCHLFSMTRQWFLMPDGETLGQKPHPDYANIRDTQSENIVGQQTVSGLQTLEGIGGKSLELEITVDPSNTAPRYGFDVRRSPGAEEFTRVYYDEPNQQIVVDKTNSSTASFNEENVLLRGDYDESAFGKPEHFHVFIDHSVLEVYVNGSAAFATRIYPVRSDSEGVALWSDGGSTVFTETKAWQVNGSVGASSVVLIQDPSSIEEGQKTNDTIHISVQNNAWAAALNPSGWVIDGYPSGLTPVVERISDAEVIITFDGTADDYDEDLTNFSVQIPASEFQQPMLFSSDMVNVSGSVEFSAVLEVPTDVDLAFIGTASDAGSLTGEELEAYNWVSANYSAAYYSLDTIMADKGILDETSSVDLVWWHFTTSNQLPSGSDIAFSRMADFRNSGGALFLSGMASLAAVEVELESTLPDVQAFGSTITAASQGIWTNTPEEVFFTGLQFETSDPNLAITIDDGTIIPERYATWSAGTTLNGFPKSWETSAHNQISLINYPSVSGQGKATILSTPSFSWVGASGNPNHQSNLEALAAGVIDELLQPVVRVSGLEIAQSNLSFSNDFYWQLISNVLPENADDQGVAYISRNPEVVEVDENGLMHALSSGQAWVVGTTSDGEFADSCLVETQSLVNPLLYSFESASLANWSQIEGTAFADNMVNLLSQFDGQPENADGWYYLDNTTEAGISGTGAVSTRNFVLSGSGLITFSGGQTGTSENLYVALVDASTQEELTRLAVSGNNWTLHEMEASAHIGKECFIKLVDEDTNGGLWIDALSIPVALGPESIVFENVPDYLPTGYPIQLEWRVVPEQTSEQSFTITSSDTNIISVDENGLATGEDAGTASVTVSLDGTEISASLSLEVKDFLRYNFETGDLTNWHVVEGNAFTDESVVSDNDWGWGGPFNHEGTYHLWGFQPNEDGATGVLQTDTFKLGGNGEISFLIGGGNDLSQLYVALIEAASGTILMRETGSDDEAYSAVNWDAKDYVGTDCYIKIVDNATGGWGHINVDDLKVPVYNADKTPIFEVSHKKLLSLKVNPNPVSRGTSFRIYIDGESVNGKEEVVAKLFNLKGKIIRSEKVYVLPGRMNIYEMEAPVEKGLYLIQAESSEFAGSVHLLVK
ncbi:GH32 C-terminal domain-containing protein [Marinilabilia sp.]